MKAREGGDASEPCRSEEPAEDVGRWPVDHKLPSLTQMPGFPVTVQTHDFGCPTAGALLNTRSPAFQKFTAGAADPVACLYVKSIGARVVVLFSPEMLIVALDCPALTRVKNENAAAIVLPQYSVIFR